MNGAGMLSLNLNAYRLVIKTKVHIFSTIRSQLAEALLVIYIYYSIAKECLFICRLFFPLNKAVRGNKPFQNGLHYFEILFKEPLYGTAICIGLGTEDCQLNYENFEYCNLVGKDSSSYGLCHKGTICHNNITKSYCDPFFDKDTVVGVLIDMAKKKIHYFINNNYMGVAFT